MVEYREGIIDALHWCRLGGVRPKDVGDFHRAKELGLLAQDDVWRTTIAGELALARRRPEAYGDLPMARECPTCGAAPGEACVGRMPHRYQLTHQRRWRV